MAVDVLNVDLITLLYEYVLGISNVALRPTYHLFSSNYVVDCETTEADLVELIAPGYAPIALAPGFWVPSVVGCIATATYPPITWTLTGPGSTGGIVYGHFVIDPATGNLLWAQTWGTPFAIPAGGGSIVISPQWQNKQC